MHLARLFLPSPTTRRSSSKLQEEFPDCVVLAYLDDSYIFGEPERAWAATERLHVLAREKCGLEPNLSKIEVYSPSPNADFSAVPASVKGLSPPRRCRPPPPPRLQVCGSVCG